MKIHGQSLESLYKDMPMRLLPVEYLPDDYNGPNAGTEKEIIGIANHYLVLICRLGVSLLRSYSSLRLSSDNCPKDNREDLLELFCVACCTRCAIDTHTHMSSCYSWFISFLGLDFCTFLLFLANPFRFCFSFALLCKILFLQY